MNLNQITIPATDVARSAAFYRAMGFALIVDALPRYARFECPEGDATFSLDHVNEPVTGPSAVLYFECADLDARVTALQSQGFVFTQFPTDERWLWREARLQDPSGNEICLFRAGENRKHPPWRTTT